VRAFTAGSLRIVVAMLGPLWNSKSLKNMEKASRRRSVTETETKGTYRRCWGSSCHRGLLVTIS
jgi:hypothetical protein